MHLLVLQLNELKFLQISLSKNTQGWPIKKVDKKITYASVSQSIYKKLYLKKSNKSKITYLMFLWIGQSIKVQKFNILNQIKY